ncbi:16S rRNA (cytosine(967)-C(5))-methyltransferase [Streptococcus rubneri]|uniref:16S rRNA (cytosine(967)-C(5))-methyltransferase n=1 Tax=Streptococcus rubneri TaxID=1234680 RepID=A0A4Z1DVJ9_9STRE|nr:16S rRNA (cytosine(967)-C(5))-methyltransferase RsmB [Streptococcus rubneri]MBK4775158.1 16S rRNA (cytosine(967)-C(5))-methyltransferase [Streptococcus rubneri]TGN91380.1 16S rRNA (cytosine(967)-C(5))-methyltransferase RsmB [Streptococcus rubneri]
MVNKMQTARGLALTILGEIFQDGAFSNIALKKGLGKANLSEVDKSLVTEIVYGTVSRKLTLEWYLSHFVADRDQIDPWIYHLLLMSLYQFVYLEKIPPHAVVHEAVELAKQRKKGSEKYVNALLRKMLREGLPSIDQIKRVNKRLSIRYSLPVWLVKKLLDEYGETRAIAIFESLYVRNKASVRVVDLDQKEDIKERLQASDSLLASTALVKENGYVAGSDYFKQGKLTIQDETSQLVAPALEIQASDQVLDACAAPGGKTVHMASYLIDGKITALDLYNHKLLLIQENANRLGVADKIETKQLDARKVSETFGPDAFDKVLVDAPCSGIGLIRRKPDIKYNKDNADFASLQAVQLEILDSVCQSVRKDGIIVYSTCTIISEENTEVVQQFLATHPNFELVPLDHERNEILKEGCILITPELYGSDGFFISRFRRIS